MSLVGKKHKEEIWIYIYTGGVLSGGQESFSVFSMSAKETLFLQTKERLRKHRQGRVITQYYRLSNQKKKTVITSL